MCYYDNLTERVAIAFKEAETREINDYQTLRGYVAAKSGMYPMGRTSHFADLVACPDDNDDLVVKATSKSDDGFILYALMCYHGMIEADWALKVFSAKRVGRRWLFVLERLHKHEHMNYDERDAVSTALRDAVGPYCRGLPSLDLHSGNVMRRKDGSLCVLDPLAHCSFKIDEKGVPVKYDKGRLTGRVDAAGLRINRHTQQQHAKRYTRDEEYCVWVWFSARHGKPSPLD